MNNGTMDLVSVLKYAVRIENESELFYKKAVEIVTDTDLKDLLAFLSDEEVGHASHLEKHIENIDPSAEKLELDEKDFYRLVEHDEITASSSKEDILKIALSRETATRDLYSRIASLTNLDATIVDLFDELHSQEAGHVNKVEAWLAKGL